MMTIDVGVKLLGVEANPMIGARVAVPATDPVGSPPGIVAPVAAGTVVVTATNLPTITALINISGTVETNRALTGPPRKAGSTVWPCGVVGSVSGMRSHGNTHQSVGVKINRNNEAEERDGSPPAPAGSSDKERKRRASSPLLRIPASNERAIERRNPVFLP